MSILGGIRRTKIPVIQTMACMLLILKPSCEPGDTQNPNKAITYGLHVITAKARQELLGNEVHGGESSNIAYQNWLNYTKKGWITADSLHLKACQVFLEALSTYHVQDTTTYTINSERLDGSICCSYYDRTHFLTGWCVEDVRNFAAWVKEQAIEGNGLSGKSVCIVRAAQFEPSYLTLPELRWDNLEDITLGQMWFKLD
ncbi:MAG: hypothetical protein NTW97_05345, partial [Candidatus Krumholzibacteria bacterium]|nr:hypothetical protein [Candidatus Krumholzibacteria bacterium]